MKRFICILILTIFLLLAYAKFIEPNTLKVNEYLITSSKLPNNFNGTKIIHFSDVLYKNNDSYSLLEKTIKEIKNLNADIIIFTGDLLASTTIDDQTKEKITNLLTEIHPRLYKYAVLGDNDSDEVKAMLENSDFIVLDNTSTFLFDGGTEPILISGGNNISNETITPDENIMYNFKIALTQEPDNFDNLKNNYDLVFAGHSLGGEIRLPFLGATLKKPGSQKYTENKYQKDNTSLYINFGLGIEKSGLRFLNNPSINVYQLYSK